MGDLGVPSDSVMRRGERRGEVSPGFRSWFMSEKKLVPTAGGEEGQV